MHRKIKVNPNGHNLVINQFKLSCTFFDLFIREIKDNNLEIEYIAIF